MRNKLRIQDESFVNYCLMQYGGGKGLIGKTHSGGFGLEFEPHFLSYPQVDVFSFGESISGNLLMALFLVGEVGDTFELPTLVGF